jgi:integrase
VAVLSKFFSWCADQNLCSDHPNPCRRVERFREEGRERFLSPEELQRLGTALREAEQQKTASPWAIGAIYLLLFTGARRSEVLTLKWEHVDFLRQRARLPDSKTGRKTIHMNGAALEILTRLPRIEGNPYVICGDKPGTHLVNVQKPWRRLRKAAGLDDVRLHDLRHTFASWGVNGGLALPIVGGLLTHTKAETTQRYAHLASDPLRAAAESVGSAIAAALCSSPAE